MSDRCVVVEFLKPMPPYNVGETAGFPELQAQLLLSNPNGICKARPDIKGAFATRSAGLDPPNFSIQQLAGVFQAATEKASEARK